jgi:hypothetical protein
MGLEKSVENFRRKSEWMKRHERLKTDMKETECEEVDWVKLAQESDQWRSLVNVVMHVLGSLQREDFLDQLSNY